MFIKKSSLGRVAALASLVLFVSLGLTSCQPASPTAPVSEPPKTESPAETPEVTPPAGPQLPEGVSLLSENDPICGLWTGTWGVLLYASPDFVWATASSGKKLAASEKGDVTIPLMNWETYEMENNHFAKSSTPTYVVYKTEDKKSGVILFNAEESPYGTPEVGKWYGVKFQIDAEDANKALVEGAAGNDYKKIETLEAAAEVFGFENTDCFDSTYWNESGSGASKVTE